MRPDDRDAPPVGAGGSLGCRWCAAKGRLVMTAYRGIWLVGCVPLVLLGLFGAGASLRVQALWLFIVAGYIGAFVRLVAGDSSKQYSWRRDGGALLRAAVLVGGYVVAVAGLSVLLGVSRFLLGLLMLVSSPYVMVRYWASRRPTGERGGVARWDAVLEALARAGNDCVAVDESSLSGWTDERLCAAWIESTRALAAARSGARTRRLVEARASFLCEMERRNAAGVAAWLEATSSAAQNPLPFITQRDVPRRGLDWDLPFPDSER